MALQGGLIHKKDIRAFYLDLLEMICALPGTDGCNYFCVVKHTKARHRDGKNHNTGLTD